MTRLEFMTRVLEIFYRADIREELLWHTDPESGEVKFAANVSDVFFWGTADCEDITVETLPELEKAYADLLECGGSMFWLGMLYAARRRGQRPQGVAYPKPNEFSFGALHDLFNACGPKRETGLGNPKRVPEPLASPEGNQSLTCRNTRKRSETYMPAKKSKPWRLVMGTPGGPVYAEYTSQPAAYRGVTEHRELARSGSSRITRIVVEKWEADYGRWVRFENVWSKSDDTPAEK